MFFDCIMATNSFEFERDVPRSSIQSGHHQRITPNFTQACAFPPEAQSASSRAA
jgi:hypothetical protein